MLAALTRDMPHGADLLYEPKWDGFRAIVFWDGAEMMLQSRDCKPLGRYFPELEKGLRSVLPARIVLDGEIVIATPSGLDFEALLMRIHPAASRVNKLAAETPSTFVAFDCLAVGDDDLMGAALRERRPRLEEALRVPLATPSPWLRLTPATTDVKLATDWFERFEGAGLDGVVAKPLALPYRPDERVMMKIKHQRTAEVVVGGYRWLKGHEGRAVGSLLLGLYDEAGTLHHVGHTSSFKADEKRALVERLAPYLDESGQASFGQGRTPGAPSRWNAGQDLSWISLRPELVCEVAFDHLQGDRFRHAATFLRWRPDKPPRDCTYDQFTSVVPYELRDIFGKA
jgi:ATP-dependent DNA ligase